MEQNLSNINVMSQTKYDELSALDDSQLYFVEDYSIVKKLSGNNNRWARIYSDGWCVQGGLTAAGAINVCDFLVPYRDTSYTAHVSLYGGLNSYPYAFSVYSKNVSGINFTQDNGSNRKFWIAMGYIY